MTDKEFSDLMQKQEERLIAHIDAQLAKTHFNQEFMKLDYSAIQKMTDKELAAWQAKYPVDTPQRIIATQEWNNRSIAKHSKTAIIIAAIGLASTVVVAIWKEDSPKPVPINCTMPPSYKSPSEHTELQSSTQGHEKKDTSTRSSVVKENVEKSAPLAPGLLTKKPLPNQ